MFVYKIIDPTSQFYLLVLSHIKDTEMVLEHSEHFFALNETDPMARFLYTLWDDVEIEVSPITPRQFLEIQEKSGAGFDLVKSDTKCMNVSNEKKTHCSTKTTWQSEENASSRRSQCSSC